MTDFISYSEAIRLLGLRQTHRLMRQALGIKRLSPYVASRVPRKGQSVNRECFSTPVSEFRRPTKI